MQNYDRGLANAFSGPMSQCFSTRTDPWLVNNYFFHPSFSTLFLREITFVIVTRIVLVSECSKRLTN